jgi:opacity protein-like surface antigen
MGGTAIEIVTGVMDFDFQGTGQTMPFNVRALTAVTDRLSLEFGATVARPVESFGGRSTFATPEARAVYAWRLGRVSPFVAGGGGFSVIRRPLFRDRWQATLTAGGGARFDLSERVYAIGEMRLRGVTTRFAASTAEWIGGIGWRFR